ncbi:transporter [Lithospermum erythrorhizon]|uniref:Transporter n=1 Tax=Lithospermum erythrorhizon TaxID=34254 RepID=A0AAV3NQ69_LITER
MDNKFGKSFADSHRSSTFGQCNESRFVFGSSSANASARFGTIPGFGTVAGSLGDSISAFSASLAPTSSGFVAVASLSGSSTSSFAASITSTSGGFGNSFLGQNREGSRITGYTPTPGDNGERGKILSICAMKIHSIKSHDELRAEDYRLGDKGGSGHASISPGSSICAAGAQQNNSNFPAASSNTTLHSRAFVFPNSFAPKPSMGTQQNHSSFTVASSNTTSHPRASAVFSNSFAPKPSMGTQQNHSSFTVASSNTTSHPCASAVFSNSFAPKPSMGTQQHNSSFPAASSNTTLPPNVPAVFPNSFAPRPGLGYVDNGWSSVAGVTPPALPNTLPWMQSQNDANGLVFSKPDVAISSVTFPNTSVLPSAPEHSNPFTSNPSSSNPFASNPSTSNPFASNPSSSNPFASQTTRDGIGGTNSTGVQPFQNVFTSFKPNASGWQTSPVNGGTQSEGSRLASYTATSDQGTDKIQSISAMPMYANQSHEELRSKDYHLGDKGGCTDRIFPSSWTEASSLSQQNPFSVPPVAPQWPSNFSQSTSPFTSQKILSPRTSGFTATNTQKSSENCFPWSNSLTNQATSSSPFSFNTSTTAHTSTSSNCVPPANKFLSSSSSSWFPSSSLPSSTSLASVSCTTPGISSGTSSFLTSNSSQSTQSSQLFAPLDGHSSSFIGTQTNPNPVPQNISSSMTPIPFPQNISSSLTPAIEQQSVINANSSEALSMAQTSVCRPGTKLSIQYGISSRPVTDNPAPARGSSLLRVRHLSVRRNRMQSEKFSAKTDPPKVAFFTEEGRNCCTVDSDSSFIPRNDPRCWISSPSKELLHKADSHVSHPQSRTNSSSEDRMSGSAKEVNHTFVNLQDHNEYLEGVLPKLRGADYYTKPSITELAAKEETEPGFCSHVKDFVVGRSGYGCIKFLGKTDIRKLELDSIIEFNHREILVYFNESMEKPPVGQGLNKPAEVTLLNIMCNDKKSGKQYIDGPRVDKYRERLIKKTAEHGAEFVSYNPVRGEWKFKVQHF